MPTFDLTRGARGRFDRRRAVLVVVTPLLAAVVVLALVDRGPSGAGGAGLGPTVVAEPRDLATTLDASGTLHRSDEHTVAHASALPSDGDGASPGGDGDGTDSGDMQPVAFVTEPDGAGSSSSTTSTTATPTTDPCSPTGTTSTSTTSSSSTTSTTPCPTTTTTSSTIPAPSTTSTTEPGADDGGGSSPSTGDPGSAGGDDGDTGSGPGGARPADGGDSAGPGGGPSGGPGGDGGSGGNDGEVPSAILTSVLDVGATADRGTVLYTADQEPVVALIGDLPAWRRLEQGVGDGADVRQLEENLAALGYGDGLDVDETFTGATAAAVEAWETDLGRAAPDGVVAMGEVVFLTGSGDVLGHEASVGDTLQAGSPVMTLGSEERVIVAEVDATEAGGWTPGSEVEIEWADGTTTQGTVIGTGRDVTDGEVELTVAISGGDAGAGQRRSGAEATVTLVDAGRDGVLAVPVAAIVDDGGAPAVRVARADGPDDVVPVETGLVADGWIEITAGLAGGEEVRLPG
jgi:membrane fusion protein, multidrug efflux system